MTKIIFVDSDGSEKVKTQNGLSLLELLIAME